MKGLCSATQTDFTKARDRLTCKSTSTFLMMNLKLLASIKEKALNLDALFGSAKPNKVKHLHAGQEAVASRAQLCSKVAMTTLGRC